jgi:phosphohistidine phosphatase
LKTLLILRHAKSSWKYAKLSDHDRPLNQRGKSDAPRMGRLLAREELVPDLIISSSAARALATAESVALACGYESDIQHTRDLYHAGPDAYIELLQEVQDDCQRVMVVGHNPDIEELLAELTGEWVRMPTAALAQVALNVDHWFDLTLENVQPLLHVWEPKELPN